MSKPYMHGLCHRCDRRAGFHEKGIRPRYECGTGMSVMSCYMYEPVKPVVLRRTKHDLRRFGFRVSPVGLADGSTEGVHVPGETKKARTAAWVFVPRGFTLVRNSDKTEVAS